MKSYEIERAAQLLSDRKRAQAQLDAIAIDNCGDLVECLRNSFFVSSRVEFTGRRRGCCNYLFLIGRSRSTSRASFIKLPAKSQASAQCANPGKDQKNNQQHRAIQLNAPAATPRAGVMIGRQPQKASGEHPQDYRYRGVFVVAHLKANVE